MEEGHNIVQIVYSAVTLLLVAAGTMAFAKKIRMPFTVALVLVGMALAQIANLGGEALSGVLSLDMPPELVFFVLLPALIFEAAFNLEVRALRENLSPVLMLAIPGLLISTAVIGSYK